MMEENNFSMEGKNLGQYTKHPERKVATEIYKSRTGRKTHEPLWHARVSLFVKLCITFLSWLTQQAKHETNNQW